MCGNNHWIITPNLTRSIHRLLLASTSPASVETTSVLLGVDTEATSHPAITISTPH